MTPLLPVSDRILPYIDRIDEARIYTNFGPLNAEYSERLEEMFEAPVVTCSSATSGLTAALMALGLPRGSLVACPSWTFVATPAAIVMAGHVPYFVDVDPSGVLRTIDAEWGKNISAAVIVSPCGAPLMYQNFSLMGLGIGPELPLVIDAAGGFDAFSTICKPGKWPVVISTHATKSFGTGEGGFITCHDEKMLEKIRRITNFGFTPMRHSEVLGFNAKLSEYHAAVGLAELDGWEDKRERYLRKTRIYGLDYATSLVAVKTGEGRKGVYGCHKHDAYKDCPRAELPVTEDLIKKVSFMPVSL